MYFACICMYDRTTPNKNAKQNIVHSIDTISTIVFEDDLSKEPMDLGTKESSFYNEFISRGVSNHCSVIKVEDEILGKSQVDEENSVIALLDDVIQNEEVLARDDSLDPSNHSTVAIVHSQVLEEECLVRSPVVLMEEKVREESKEFVDTTLGSAEISYSLEQINDKKRKLSEHSEHLNTLTLDPLHSENFKQKLSRLISSPQPPVNTYKKQTTHDESDKESKTRLPIRPSKSAEDIRKLLLAVIMDNRAHDKSKSGIPEPPKFDPVLYKTINSPYQLQSKTCIKVKNRPSIKEITDVRYLKSSPSPVEHTIESTSNFKAKLEEVLRIGPSHKKSDGILNPMIRRKSSSIDENYKSIIQTIRANKVLSMEKSAVDSNNNHLQNDSLVIKSTRNSLKPIS